MIEVRVPATTANLGPGFDCLGLALDLYNTLQVFPSDDGLVITVTGEGSDILSTCTKNLVYETITYYFQRVIGSSPPPLALKLNNKIPLARGMGSSAAAIVSGLVAANQLSGQALPIQDLLPLAVELEGHPDNVAPALLGGVVLSTSEAETAEHRYLKLSPPRGLQAVVCIPDYTLSTSTARRVLPKQVPFADAVFNVGRVALLMGVLSSQRWDLLDLALEDRLHQPYRSPLIPGMGEAIMAAKQAGALGAALSGSGPTILAFVLQGTTGVGEAMEEAFSQRGIASRSLVLNFNENGVHCNITP